MLMAVAEGATAGFRQPEHRVVGCSDQVVPEVGDAAREGELGDAGRDVHRELERDEAGAASRQVGTVDRGASGRGWMTVHGLTLRDRAPPADATGVGSARAVP